MGKQPYIPIYIGDWEQDTNCLSLEAEGACLKIVFKCWKNQGIFMTNIESVCRLLKISEQKFASVLLELKTNQIFDITEREDGAILFTSRRVVRDLEISAKRKVSGSKGGSKKVANTLANHVAKPKQNPEYEYDNENDIESKKILKSGGDFKETFKQAFDGITLENFAMQFSQLDVANELQIFELKCNAHPKDYHNRDYGGLRLAFLHQLKNSYGKKPKSALTDLTNL